MPSEKNTLCVDSHACRARGFFIDGRLLRRAHERQSHQKGCQLDAQTIINAAFALAGGLGGWVLNSLRDSIATLQAQDKELTKKVQQIEVLVAGTYVKRDELDKLGNALFARLDRIEGKLDKKADKQ